MPKLPKVTGKQLVAALSSLGFQLVRTHGSHAFLRHPDGRATVVPVHSGETIGPGLLSRILRDCEIARDDLHNAL
ncbi:MAG: type II toxin-antitoxin system HicA family toxin [Thermoanaerobaculia bacterium]